MKTLIIPILAACALLSGCGNMDMCDTNYTYDRALVKWPDGSMKEIKIKQWSDYPGEQIQIIGRDRKIYLVSMNNAVLVRDQGLGIPEAKTSCPAWPCFHEASWSCMQSYYRRMNNKTILTVTVDCINLQNTTVWSKLQKRIDRYNVKRGMKKGLGYIRFGLDITYASFVPAEIQHLIDAMARNAIGIKPYEEIENESAIQTVELDDSNVIICMTGIDTAADWSEYSDPDDDIVYRGFVSDYSNEYKDYRLGKEIGHGQFC